MKDDAGRGRWCVAKETEISSDFECGTGDHIRWIGEDHFALDVHRDWGAGDPYSMMSWVFCVKITNRSSAARTLELDVRNSNHSGHDEAYVWAKRGDFWDRAFASVLPGSDDDWGFRATVRMDAGETVYLSNGYWYPPSEMTAWLADIAEKHSDLCTLRKIGQTAQARPISVLTISDPKPSEKKARILIAASPQGSEIGVWACRHLIEFLLGDDPFAESARKTWTVDVIPQTNPDGEALGTVMVNALGENPLFEFKEVADGGNGSAEAVALWNWAKNHPPAIYLEYHCYYQANRPSFRPYLFSSDLHRSEARRTLAEEVAKRLLQISTGPPMMVEVGNEPFSQCFPYQLIERFDTIAHFYKLHMRESLKDNLNQAVRVFKTVVEVCEGI
jgi:hypothetical protein